MGKLIVIDGLDGSGKKTQVDILVSKLKQMGKNVHMIDFPDYDSESSAPVKMYLRGDIGHDPSKLNPYLCSLFYTVDRGIQFNKTMFNWYNEPDSILVANRYISANVIHQGAKIDSAEDKKKYFEWIYNLEIEKVGLPKDNITIILSLPVEVSQKLMDGRYKANGGSKDIHEADMAYLHKCYNTVDIAVKHLSSLGYNWKKIDCSENGDIRSKDSIEKDIWDNIKHLV